MQTRERMLAAALKLFAERGFYGASMDQIAAEVGLTKQALIHHFGSKEKLYGTVLAQISGSLQAALVDAGSGPAEEAFARAALEILDHSLEHPAETHLLMRELLDNKRRAAQAGTWYLRPFLDELLRLLGQSPGWRGAEKARAATHVYLVMGAINYFAVSTTTLSNMYSPAHVAAMLQEFPAQLRRLALAGPLGPGPEAPGG